MADQQAVKLDDSWKAVLAPEFESPYMAALKAFLQEEKAAGKVIFPRDRSIFARLI